METRRGGKKNSQEKKLDKEIKKIKEKKLKETYSKNKFSSTLKITSEEEIALDLSIKLYKRFDKIIKSTILFGSTVKKEALPHSDIDLIIIIDDATIFWNQELVVWYREELEKILRTNPYKKKIHINTIKLSTWWEDLLRGDPVVINMIRYGEPVIDLAGFFEPIKALLIQGKIKSTPESIYSALQRAPLHLRQSKIAEMSSIEGVYWCMVDSAQAALISAGIAPPSPEHIPIDLKETFVDKGKLKMDFVKDFRDIYLLHKQISHGEVHDLKGIEIDTWQDKSEKFLEKMIELVKEQIE